MQGKAVREHHLIAGVCESLIISKTEQTLVIVLTGARGMMVVTMHGAFSQNR